MEKIVDRIRKLLALAENNPSEAEREAALKKAHALLIEHNLQMQDVSEHQEIMEAFASHMNFRPTPWTRTIVNAIAELYFCKFVFHRGAKQREFTAKFIGMRVDADVARVVAESVLTSIKTECAAYVRTVGGGETSFKNAAAAAIYWRCKRLREDSQNEKVAGTALVVQSLYKTRMAEAQAWMDENMGPLKTSKGKLRVQQDEAGRAGAAAANAVGLTLNVKK